MKKILIVLFIWFSLLFADIDKNKEKVKELYKERKDEFGKMFRQKLIEEIGTETEVYKKVDEGIYNETILNEIEEEITNEVIDEYVKGIAERMKPIKIDVIKLVELPIEVIEIEITKLTPLEVKEITLEAIKLGVLKPEIAYILITKLTPIDIADLIVKLDIQDVNKLVYILHKSFNFAIEQAQFLKLWEKKDISELANLVSRIIQVKYPEFFIAYGNYNNYDEINWNKRQDGFNYRQVLVNAIKYDWKEKFKPNDKIILTINFGLKSFEIKALLDMIKENRDKIVMIILPWGNSRVNNIDNTDISSYSEVGKWADKLFYSIKQVAPEIPVGLTVCWTEDTMREWMNSFKAPYDFYNIWNIFTISQAPLETIRVKFVNMFPPPRFKNSTKIVLSVFECDPTSGWIEFEKAKEKLLLNYEKAKKEKFLGVILLSGLLTED